MIVGSAAGFSPKILNWFINTKYKLIGGCLRITQFFSPHVDDSTLRTTSNCTGFAR